MHPTQLQYGKDCNGKRYGDKTMSTIVNLGGDSMAMIYSGGVVVACFRLGVKRIASLPVRLLLLLS